MILAAFALVLAMQRAAPPPALADVAKKAEEQRAQQGAEPQADADASQPDAATGGDRKRADAADEKQADAKKKKTAFTNSDLKTAPAPAAAAPDGTLQPAWRAPSSDATAGDVAEDALAKMRNEARYRFSVPLVAMRSRLASYNGLAENFYVTCQRDSYKGLSPSAADSHNTYCRQQLSRLKAEKKVIDAGVDSMQAEAAKRGIYPGVMRDLLAEIGWRP